MTKQEIKDIGLDLTILTEYVLDDETTAEAMANCSINFLKNILKSYPQLKLFVDEMINSFDKNDEKFDKKWDIMIKWYDFEKRYLI